jgi:hypothetical protein
VAVVPERNPVTALPHQESDFAFFKKETYHLRILVAFSTSILVHQFPLAKQKGT